MIIFTDVAAPLEKTMGRKLGQDQTTPSGNVRVLKLRRNSSRSAKTADYPRGDAVLTGRAESTNEELQSTNEELSPPTRS